jgi:hypothetical protein
VHPIVRRKIDMRILLVEDDEMNRDRALRDDFCPEAG